MKHLTFIILFLAATITSQAQTRSDEQQAIALLQTFYKQYMTVSTSSARDDEKMLRALRKKYCTTHLLNNIAKRSDPNRLDWIDWDPFTKAQDFNPAWVKSLSFKRNSKQPNLYTVSFYDFDQTTKKKEAMIINVFVTKEKDGLKISSLYVDADGGYRDRL